LIAGTILLVWCLAKRLRPTWSKSAPASSSVFSSSDCHGTLPLGRAKSALRPASLLIATNRSGFSCSVLPLPVDALERRPFGRDSPGFAGVGLLMGRSALNSGPGVLSLARGRLGALSWSVGDWSIPGVRISPASASFVGASLLAGSFNCYSSENAVGEYRGFFARIHSALVAGARVPHSLRAGVAFTPTNWLLGNTLPRLVATHTYVNPLSPSCLAGCSPAKAVTLNVLLSRLWSLGGR